MKANVFLPEIDEALKEFLHRRPRTEPLFWEMVDYYYDWSTSAEARSSGKRARPLMTILAARAICGQHRHVMPAAISLQIIHDFSLVLDDIVDGDELRRNRPSLWSRWGVNQAMTASTGLYTLGFFATLDLLKAGPPHWRSLRAAESILEACMETHDAQLRDLSFEDTFEVSLQQCIRTTAGRSALFACSARVGALLSTEDEEVVNAYTELGQQMATAFSLVDDYLDIWPPETQAEAPPFSDIKRRKKSFPVLIAYQKAREGARATLTSLYNKKQALTDDEARRVVQILEEANAAHETVALIEQYRMRSLEIIRGTGVRDTYQADLLEFASQLLPEHLTPAKLERR
jgi:geranylgeranyl diphosphate synthase type I